MSNNKPYYVLKSHYESCLAEFGDTNKGVDWPNQDDAKLRYRIMLDILKYFPDPNEFSVLDFGCGAAHLYDYILSQNIPNINYSGLDISESFVSLCKKKYPSNNFFSGDVLSSKLDIGCFDFVICNGVFTEKQSMTWDQMWNFVQELLPYVFQHANHGIAVNFMHSNVDWERDDLFHLPFDKLYAFCADKMSRHVCLRSDYGLYEYTAYILKTPA